MSVSLSAKPASQGQEGGPHGNKERSPRLENSRDMPGSYRGISEVIKNTESQHRIEVCSGQRQRRNFDVVQQ